jgi:hypothetical protein
MLEISHYPEPIFVLQAELEYGRIREVQASVEARYDNLRPLHHHPSARQLEFDRKASVFFVANYEDYLKLSASQVQEIFRHRHIVVYDVPTEDMEFDRDGLSSLGSLTQPMDIQGEFQVYRQVDSQDLSIVFKKHSWVSPCGVKWWIRHAPVRQSGTLISSVPG